MEVEFKLLKGNSFNLLFRDWYSKISDDGFGNQSYLTVHLLTLANLLVQFQHKNNASSFSQYI